jgi:hypothetical protein
MRKILAGVLSVALVTGVAFAAELKSGPQVGDKLPGAFHPLNVNGESAGKKACLVCKHGASPVVAIFARCSDCETTQKLITSIDKVTGEHSKCEMGSFAVFLTDDDKTESKLKTMAEKASLKNLTLSIDNPQGPAKYSIAKDADVTVILYTEHKVKANYAFKKGEMKDSDVEAIVKDVAKIVPEKK